MQNAVHYSAIHFPKIDLYFYSTPVDDATNWLVHSCHMQLKDEEYYYDGRSWRLYWIPKKVPKIRNLCADCPLADCMKNGKPSTESHPMLSQSRANIVLPESCGEWPEHLLRDRSIFWETAEHLLRDWSIFCDTRAQSLVLQQCPDLACGGFVLQPLRSQCSVTPKQWKPECPKIASDITGLKSTTRSERWEIGAPKGRIRTKRSDLLQHWEGFRDRSPT